MKRAVCVLLCVLLTGCGGGTAGGVLGQKETTVVLYPSEPATVSKQAPEPLPGSDGATVIPETGGADAVLPEGGELPESGEDTRAASYVLNTRTKKFHRPDCASAVGMKAENRKAFSGSREEVLALGYEPCGRCEP